MAVTLNANTSTGFIATSDTSGVLQLQTGGTAAVTVDASANVGIGTASPTTKLDNTGSFRSTGATDPTSGTGLELSYRSTYGDVLAYNRTSSTFAELQIRGAPIIFGNAGGERMRILTTGNILSLAGGSTTATGTGIAFPATQSASSDVNTLDDYEEGTWTPTITFSGGNGNLAYSVREGTYTKIGRCVSFIMRVTFGETTAAGYLASISGLPFTSAYYAGSGVYIDNLSSVTGAPTWVLPDSSTSFSVYMSATGAATVIGVASIPSANAVIIISGVYFTT